MLFVTASPDPPTWIPSTCMMKTILCHGHGTGKEEQQAQDAVENIAKSDGTQGSLTIPGPDRCWGEANHPKCGHKCSEKPFSNGTNRFLVQSFQSRTPHVHLVE